jgi:predicted RNA-binding protein with RPS1 domain
VNPEVAARVLNAGAPTVADILEALAKPGRDPREDLPPPIFKKGVLRLEDIHPGMDLKGTVLNVVPFGAFVDIGLKESGLVHISQMANRYIKSPYDVVSVGDVVTVWVIEVKPGEKKISLSMIQPGQERRPPEPRRFDGPREQRPPRQDGPPRQQQPQGDRPGQGTPPRRFDGPRPGGNRPGGPPQRGGFVPRPQAQPKPADGEGNTPPAQAPRPQPPRPPAKPKPLPKLTAEKKSGKAALNTFGELLAFFKKDEPEAPKPAEQPPPPPKAEDKPAAETPPPDAPPAT